MAFSLDPVEYFKKTSGFDSDKTNYFAPQVTGGLAGAAKKYRSEFGGGEEYSPMLPGASVASTAGTQSLFGDQFKQNEQEYQLATKTLGYGGEIDAAKQQSDANRSAADRQASASKTGAIISAVGGVGAAVIGGLI